MLIELVGKFYDNHSLSIVNRNIALELSKIAEVQIVPIDSVNSLYNLDEETISTLTSLETSRGVPDIQLRHSYPPILAWPDDAKTKVVFIQPWEYSKAPFEWQYKFETFADAVIVPSKYTKSVFINGGINPNKIHVVPNGYNHEVFNTTDNGIVIPELTDNKLNIAYVGNSQWRKGLDILLHVWSGIFTKADNVRLIIKDNSRVYGRTQLLSDLVKRQYKTNCAEILYIDRELSEQEMATLYRRSKVLVHPYRAEGFAMHVQEAMACGSVPVVSAEGPTDDFVTDKTGIKIPVNTRLVDITDSAIFAIKPGDSVTLMGSHTAVKEPDLNALASILSNIYHSHDTEKYLAKYKPEYMVNTWAHVARLYLDVLTSVDSNQKVCRS